MREKNMKIPKKIRKAVVEFRNSFNHNWIVYSDSGLQMFEKIPYQKNDGTWTCDGAYWNVNDKFNTDMFRGKCEDNKPYYIDLEYHPHGIPNEKAGSIIKVNIISKEEYLKKMENEKEISEYGEI